MLNKPSERYLFQTKKYNHFNKLEKSPENANKIINEILRAQFKYSFILNLFFNPSNKENFQVSAQFSLYSVVVPFKSWLWQRAFEFNLPSSVLADKQLICDPNKQNGTNGNWRLRPGGERATCGG